MPCPFSRETQQGNRCPSRSRFWWSCPDAATQLMRKDLRYHANRGSIQTPLSMRMLRRALALAVLATVLAFSQADELYCASLHRPSGEALVSATGHDNGDNGTGHRQTETSAFKAAAKGVSSDGQRRRLRWLNPLLTDQEKSGAEFPAPYSGRLSFLRFAGHACSPRQIIAANGNSLPIESLSKHSTLVAPFQQLWIDTLQLPIDAAKPGTHLRLVGVETGDAFWDQVIIADPDAIGQLPRYTLHETGTFGSALPASVRGIDLSDAEVAAQRARLDDPIIPEGVSHEISWDDLEKAAWPLDFQKVLLASPNDAAPGFAWQNGQWITTWRTRDPRLAGDAKEDHWFAPALLVGDTIIRPAPLSARSSFLKTPEGRTLPQVSFEWSFGEATVRQTLFSHRNEPNGGSRIFVRFEISNAPSGVRLALGLGIRPNCHHWDNSKQPRTPVLFFSMEPVVRKVDRAVFDADGSLLLASDQPFTLETLGPLEKLLVFALPPNGRIEITTPQAADFLPSSTAKDSFAAAEESFIAYWRRNLARGAQVRVPDPQWMERIDIWHSQVESITRVNYAQEDEPEVERLSYGAYFYQYYFGIEEGWSALAQAKWGRFDEAQRQAEIMLRSDNLKKSNVHHQSRNGIAPLVAATVAHLSRDRTWLSRVAPSMLECARWTERVRHPPDDARPGRLRGLLPPHIYGGDVRDAATSLYASAVCWKGLDATAKIFRELGTGELALEGERLARQADEFRERIAIAFQEATVRDLVPAFVPFAISIPSMGGRNEGPHPEITATRYGNYWNLFAPSFLELGFEDPKSPGEPSRSIFNYAARHGGQWAGLPRFYAGMDAAYMCGYVGWLIDEAVRNPERRHQALASLQSFMLHGSSRNGHTIPEVVGLFPHRLQRAAYETLTREAPWSFGMYEADRYLEGQLSFSEPLGSVAGAALSLIRNAIVSESDDGLMLLPVVPSAWFAEGKEIEVLEMPTSHGVLTFKMRSRIASERAVVIDYVFKQHRSGEKIRMSARISPPGEAMKEVTVIAGDRGVIGANF